MGVFYLKISILIPFVGVTVIYVLIKHRLSITEANLNKQQHQLENPTVNAEILKNDKSLKQKRYELKKTQRLNSQLIAVMICYLLSFLVAFVLQFRYIIPDFNLKFYYFRQLLRILNVFFQSLIPIVSLYFNPRLTRIIKRFLARRCGKQKQQRGRTYQINNNSNLRSPTLPKIEVVAQ